MELAAEVEEACTEAEEQAGGAEEEVASMEAGAFREAAVALTAVGAFLEAGRPRLTFRLRPSTSAHRPAALASLS